MPITAASTRGVKNAWFLPVRTRQNRIALRVLASVSYCPHPDAVKRRQEAEALRQQRSREHSEDEMIQAMGLKWWEGSLPGNMIAVTTPRELDILSRQAYAAGRGVLINYFQEDCYACRCLHKKLKQLALDNPEVLFLKVNGSNEALRPVFEDAGVTKVPFFHCVRDGYVLSRFSASLNPEKLALLRKELLAMARARKAVNA
ncbi:hypothetical protein Vretimale_13254 [Volvox reticuliferus]|uniref:Thioredoxin domain-containing protein n=1 Tax=Volvox reticuliferus TaxID=1737510 RepID=A0A8J4CP60_9CHLO|nr:hypothetical protein Vretifemale_14191 [Volvox reticuliferus]GIM09387.1 hypothetical protein Vretimale_13254 [Volvox reticuliferus]